MSCYNLCLYISIEGAAEAEIKSFRGRFNAIKKSTMQCLGKCCVAVMTVVHMLMNIRAVDKHSMFPEKKHKAFFRRRSHLELFSLLDLYWNYLAHDLLDQLIQQLNVTENQSSFKTICKDMLTYNTDLQKFKKCTKLELFCQVAVSDYDDSTEDDPPPGFRKLVVRHQWRNTATLDDVEQFRKCYARKYNLQKCAMILHTCSSRSKCFEITWFVPVTVIDALRKERALQVYREFEVSSVEIYVHTTGVCVYLNPLQTHVSLNRVLCAQ